jgi:hypothetical protein
VKRAEMKFKVDVNGCDRIKSLCVVLENKKE